ncbi:hypothetical protein JHK82_050359 [Glycine max]|nr:hypothetical protein JHK85_050996 [Glycine max]KAG5091581.1 hypothetical protein JHK82_050359 [Glycine max]
MLGNISSNTHKFDIPMKRAQLIFAIIKGLSIDIGQTFSHEIFSMAGKKSLPPSLSALIITLCVKKGLDIFEDWAQPFVDLQPTIDAPYIEKRIWIDGDSLPRLEPLPPKPLSLNEILEKMHEEITLKFDANHRSNLILFYHLRGTLRPKGLWAIETGGADGDATNEDHVVRVNVDVAKNMEPTTETRTDEDVELNDVGVVDGDVVFEKTSARDFTTEDDEIASKETNEVLNIIGNAIFAINEETIFEKEAQKDIVVEVEATGDTTESVTDEVANIIGIVIFAINEETIVEKEAQKDIVVEVEAIGDTTESVTNEDQIEEEIATK